MTCTPAASPRTPFLPLLDLVAVVSQLTTDFRDLPLIPRALVAMLPLSHVTLAIMHEPAASPSEAILLASASSDRLPVPPESFRTAALNRAIHGPNSPDNPARTDQVLPLRHDRGPALHPHDGSTAPVTIVAPLVHSHRMLLIAYRADGTHSATEDFLLAFDALHRLLPRYLTALIAVRTDPKVLGTPFTSLTPNEWRVLLHLDCDEGEKQLSTRLHMPPDTLHSYIKAIYRKLSVNNRLAAVRRLRQATTEHRLRTVVREPSPASLIASHVHHSPPTSSPAR